MGKWDEFFERPLKGAFGRGAFDARGGAEGAARAGDETLVGRVARTAFRLFKNEGLAPPWVREREQIDAAIQGARADLLRSWNVYQEGLKSRRRAAQAEDDWRRVLGAFRRHVADLNRRIAASNLKAPSAKFRRRPLDPEHEIEAVAGRQ